MSTSCSPVWDTELGVWKGEMASGSEISELPTPLYIFGYGSLIWNPGALLSPLQSFHCAALGWTRLFAQRSCDHRGTVQFPGLVLNLVEDIKLEQLQYRMNGSEQSQCFGMIWYVPPDNTEEVIADLDYRERGGYSRHIIKVKLLESTKYHKKDDVVDAVVYTGAEYNPNFFLPHNIHADCCINEAGAYVGDMFHFSGRNMVSDIIAAAHGPSGANRDYLFSLERHLHELGMVDKYLIELARSVARRLGPWRSRQYHRHNTLHNSDNVTTKATKLFGWGANEFYQLHNGCISHDAIPHPYLVDIKDHHYYATDISGQLVSMNNEKKTTTFNKSSINHVVAGGGTTAVIRSDGSVLIWGKLALKILTQGGGYSDASAVDVTSLGAIVVVEGVDCIALGHDHCLLLLHSGHAVGFGSDSHNQLSGRTSSDSEGNNDFLIQPKDVVLAAETTDQHRFRVGSKCSTQMTAIQNNHKPNIRILKLAVGLRHSAAITVDGCLLTWGDHTHSQCLQQHEWRPEGGSTKLCDVACGARYTVVLDSEGRIYTFGSDKHGCLGRQQTDNDICNVENVGNSVHSNSDRRRSKQEVCSNVPGEVQGLPVDVRWQRVVSGWSHVVIRGIRPDGQLVFMTWGRKDLGQYLIDSSEDVTQHSDDLTATASDCSTPRELRALPNGKLAAEVWCGSEYTIVSDEDGALWGCGWNEHGNIGNGDKDCKNVVTEWQRVVWKNDQMECGQPVILDSVWEGALACGGGHVVCMSV